MELLHHILDILEISNHPKELKPITPEPIQAVWNRLPADITALAVIFEPVGSYVGRETIMHLLPNLHDIAVRRALSSNHVLLHGLEINEPAPLVVFLEKNLPGQRGVVSKSNSES